MATPKEVRKITRYAVSSVSLALSLSCVMDTEVLGNQRPH